MVGGQEREGSNTENYITAKNSQDILPIVGERARGWNMLWKVTRATDRGIKNHRQLYLGEVS